MTVDVSERAFEEAIECAVLGHGHTARGARRAA
jgi:hypothetical protein